MDIREATTDELFARMDVLEAYHTQMDRYGFVPQNVEDEVFDGDPDPEYAWNRWGALDNEVTRRVKAGEYA